MSALRKRLGERFNALRVNARVPELAPLDPLTNSIGDSMVARRMAVGALTVAGLASIFSARSAEAAPEATCATNSEVDPASAPFYADPTGVRDSTSAINAAFALRLGARLRIRAHCNYLVLGAVNVPRGSLLLGEGAKASDATLGSAPDFAALPKITLGPAGIINLADGAGVRGLATIYHAVAALLPCTQANMAAIVAAFSTTTAFISKGNDTFLDQVQVYGFGQAASCTNYGRTLYNKVSFDCTNGLLISGGLDRGWMLDCEGWPFLNADAANGGGDVTALTRSGTAFEFRGLCDWATSIDCFSFGYGHGHVVDGASNIKVIRPSHDNCGVPGRTIDLSGLRFPQGNPNHPIAISYINGAWYGTVESPFVTAHLHGVINSATLTDAKGGLLQIIGGNLLCQSDCIVNNGAGGVSVGGGCFMEGGGYGVRIAAGSSSCSIIGNYFSALVYGPIFIDPSLIVLGMSNVTKFANMMEGVTDPYPDTNQNTAIFGAINQQGAVIAQDRRPAAVGNGGELAVSSAYGGGGDPLYGRQWGIRGSATNSAKGSEASNLVFRTYRRGGFADVLTITSTGDIEPSSAGTQSIGSMALPFNQITAGAYVLPTISGIPAPTGIRNCAEIQVDGNGNIYIATQRHVYKLTPTLVSG